MSMNKRLLAIFMGLALTGCSAASSEDSGNGELMLSALDEDEASSFGTGETVTVSRRDLKMSYTFTASRVFPLGEDITYSNEYAKTIVFGESLVEEGDFVEEGQQVIVLHQYIDEIDEEETRLKYERESASYASACENYESQLELLTEGELEYVELLHEYESYKTAEEASLLELETALEAYAETKENPDIYLTAPFDGYVEYVVDHYENETVSDGEILVSLQDISVWYYTLADSSESISVGKQAVLYDDTWDNGVLEINGTVVCADKALENSEDKGYAIVVASSIVENGEDVTDTFNPADLPATLDVEMYQLEINNVLAVPTSYVYTNSDKYYVYKLEGDAQVKTWVVCPYDSVDGYYWVISGIEEGDVLVKAN